MVQVHSSPTTIVKIVPKDGELEIKLDITINLNTDNLTVMATTKENETLKTKEKEPDLLVPDFVSGTKLSFGKIVKEQ